MDWSNEKRRTKALRNKSENETTRRRRVYRLHRWGRKKEEWNCRDREKIKTAQDK